MKETKSELRLAAWSVGGIVVMVLGSLIAGLQALQSSGALAEGSNASVIVPVVIAIATSLSVALGSRSAQGVSSSYTEARTQVKKAQLRNERVF